MFQRIASALARLVTLTAILCTSHPATAHNGAVAVAVPVQGIAVDGDLSDWPEDLTVYPIASHEFSEPPAGPEDVRGSFRCGYDPAAQRLLVAVEVADQSILATYQTGWDPYNQQDGCEVFFDLEHGERTSPVLQVAMWGEVTRVYRSGISTSQKGVQTAARHANGRLWYELAVEVREAWGGSLTPGAIVGLDISVNDKDEDGSFTVMTWGRGGSKFSERLAYNRGDLALARSGIQIGVLAGRAEWTDPRDGIAHRRLRIDRAGGPSAWLSVSTDRDGAFQVSLPPGEYRVHTGPGSASGVGAAGAVQPGRTAVVKVLVPLVPPAAIATGSGDRMPAGGGTATGAWQSWGAADGLPPLSIVLDIAQDARGDLWLGMAEGSVVRYDGAEFEHFSPPGGESGADVVALICDRQGILWGATQGDGLKRIDGRTLTVYTEEQGLASDMATSVAEDSSGSLWIGTAAGVSRFDGRRFTTYTRADGLAGDDVQAVVCDALGRVWVGSRHVGVSVYEGGRFQAVGTKGAGAGMDVMSLCCTRDGSVYAGTMNGHVYRHTDGQFEELVLPEATLHGAIATLEEDSFGSLWISTAGDGLFRYAGGQLTHFSTADGLGNARVMGMCEDRTGLLWFGTADGISRYAGEQTRTYGTGDGLPHLMISSVAVGPRATVWLGSQAGAARLEGDRFQPATQAEGLPGNVVSALLPDREGRMWIGTDAGLRRLSADGTVTFTETDGLANTLITCGLQDSRGDLWLGSLSGLTRYDGTRFAVLTEADGLPGNVVLHIAEDRQGHLWICTDSGLARYDGRRFTRYAAPEGLPGVPAYVEAGDSAGRLLVSTDAGLLQFDGTRFTPLAEASSLLTGSCRPVVRDAKNRLWMGIMGRGVACYDGTVLQTVDRHDGLPSNLVNDLSLAPDGSLWIASDGGLTRYRPSTEPPRIHLTDVQTDVRHGPVDSLRVPSSQSLLAFEFQGCSFTTRPGQMIYLYRLVGYDAQWRQTRQARVEYTELPMGHYVFEVQAVDRDLNYSLQPARAAIEVFHQPLTSSVRMNDVIVDDLFASFHRSYVTRPVGSVRVVNDDLSPVEARVSLFLPGLMPRPTEETVALPPGSSQRVALHAVLSPDVLAQEGARPVQAQVALSCAAGEQTVSVSETRDIVLYGRGSLTWDILARAAAFVTPDDPAVADFARGLLQAHRARLTGRRTDGRLPEAMLLYEALAAHGIRYARDASTPYSQVRTDRAAVDHVQYPAELLHSRMGDCDDCTALYCALLENLDIPTALVDAPDHVLALFDTGVTERYLLGFSLPEERYFLRGEHVWVPVEVTLLGTGTFLEAWSAGASTCRRLEGEGNLRVTEVRQAWGDYPSCPLPPGEGVKLPDAASVDQALSAALHQLDVLREDYVQRSYVDPLLADPTDHTRRLELGKTWIESERYNEAITVLQGLLGTAWRAEACYLIGYALVGRGDYQAGLVYFGQAAAADPLNEGYAHSLEALRQYLAER